MKPPQYLVTVIKSIGVKTGGAWVKLEKVTGSEKSFVKQGVDIRRKKDVPLPRAEGCSEQDSKLMFVKICMSS